MVKGWRKQRLATGPRNSHVGTFEDFCLTQQCRIHARDFRRHPGEDYELMRERLARAANDHFVRPVLLRDAVVERRGRV